MLAALGVVFTAQMGLFYFGLDLTLASRGILLANLQGPKLTVILGMQTSLGVIFYSSIFFATDLLSEKYGRDEANCAVRIGFSLSLILVVMLRLRGHNFQADLN